MIQNLFKVVHKDFFFLLQLKVFPIFQVFLEQLIKNLIYKTLKKILFWKFRFPSNCLSFKQIILHFKASFLRFINKIGQILLFYQGVAILQDKGLSGTVRLLKVFTKILGF